MVWASTPADPSSRTTPPSKTLKCKQIAGLLCKQMAAKFRNKPESSFDFDGKIYMPRCINQVNIMIIPWKTNKKSREIEFCSNNHVPKRDVQ